MPFAATTCVCTGRKIVALPVFGTLTFPTTLPLTSTWTLPPSRSLARWRTRAAGSLPEGAMPLMV